MPKIKNIAIFIIIGAIFVLIYFFYIKKDPDDGITLVSSSGAPAVAQTSPAEANSKVAQEFLTLLLSVKGIELEDSIFSDEAFLSLKDSSITLIQDGTEGRPNPFAPLGNDIFEPLVVTASDDEDETETENEDEDEATTGVNP